MTILDGALRRAVADLRAEGARFALVGGLAVSAWAEPRLTRDADLAVSVADDSEAEALVHRLHGRGYRVGALVEQAHIGRLATARLLDGSDSGLYVDLLFASSGIEPELVEGAAHVAVVADLVVPVATVGYLIALKLLAREDRSRPNDADDLASLSAVASDADWAVAAAAVELIEQRGYHRDRDLPTALRDLRQWGAYGPRPEE